MRITIFGSGYVGLVTGACFANVGNQVVCVDIDESKIEALRQGQIPIYEPGLEDIIKNCVEEGSLSFTTDASMAVDHGQMIFIAVGTPPEEDGSADLQYVLAVANTIGEQMDDYKVEVNKSTVPVGTADKVTAALRLALDKRGAVYDFSVASNP